MPAVVRPRGYIVVFFDWIEPKKKKKVMQSEALSLMGQEMQHIFTR